MHSNTSSIIQKLLEKRKEGSCNKRKIVEQILQIFHQDFESRPTSPYQACLKKEKKKETIVK